MTEMVMSRVFSLEKRSREIETTSLIRAGWFFFFGGGCYAAQAMWDLSSLTRDQTCAPCSGSTEKSQEEVLNICM